MLAGRESAVQRRKSHAEKTGAHSAQQTACTMDMSPVWRFNFSSTPEFVLRPVDIDSSSPSPSPLHF